MNRLRSEFLLILASLSIAFVIWLIARQGDLDSDWLTVPVEISNLPPNMTIDAPRTVSINVQYPIELANRIVEKNFRLPIDAQTLFSADPAQWEKNPNAPKIVDFKVEPETIKRSNLPQLVRILGADPERISLQATLITHKAEVDVRTTGSLPSNLDLTGPLAANPRQVLVTGAPEAIEALAERDYRLPTAPINLAALRGSGMLFPKLIVPPGVQLVGLPDPTVTVEVAVQERSVRQTLDNVPIVILSFTAGLTARVTPPAADVIIEGPASALSSITADAIVFNPSRQLIEAAGRPQEVGIEARLKTSVPNEVASQISIREVRPPRIAVEFVPADGENIGLPAAP